MEGASDDRVDPTRGSEMTQTVVWSTSNANIANVVRGRVTGNAPGTATILASFRSGDETLSASVVVIVDDEHPCPTLAFDVKGVVRDVSNTGITNVEVTLVDEQGRTRTLVTPESVRPSDGSFQFVPVLGGQYRLRARKPGYRSVERLLNVPDAAPLTLVLLAEPL
jgi:Carboxypeptidase regulatory-like domain